MTTNLIPFEFESQAVRVIDRDGEPWFVGNDVCAVLEVADARQAVARLDEDERGVFNVPTPSGDQEMRCINESGLYSLVLTSRKPAAKRFKKWVTAEVLPTIRKTGAYGVPAAIPDLSDPVLLVRLLTEHASKRIEAEKRAAAAEREVEEARPKSLFYDHFANADGLYTLQNAGRVINGRPNKFIQELKREHLFYQGGSLVPRVQYRQAGLFEVKVDIIDDKARPQTFITPKGLQHFAKKFGGPLSPEGAPHA
ncbi:phage antirepressor [Azorhizobium caulinodans]|uniref:phage antirepressor n=1 Tax=Azorhizobium caulinodans TaxID=7 RepID=UPI002FBEE5D1